MDSRVSPAKKDQSKLLRRLVAAIIIILVMPRVTVESNKESLQTQGEEAKTAHHLMHHYINMSTTITHKPISSHH
jgi:hypothetical protein